MKQDNKIPKCIGIIMDGNRRWARAQGVPTLEGHRQGYEKVKDFIGWADDAGVSNLIAYAFSTENWKRREEEVSYLMNIFSTALDEVPEQAKKRKGRVSVVGQVERLNPTLQEKVKKIEEEMKHNTGIHLTLAISYGGRAEIIDAVNKIIASGEQNVDEENFRKYLWSAELPDPDIILRTSGEQRLSGFLTWASVYSELYFIEKHWPAFERSDFDALLAEYASRERRHGK